VNCQKKRQLKTKQQSYWEERKGKGKAKRGKITTSGRRREESGALIKIAKLREQRKNCKNQTGPRNNFDWGEKVPEWIKQSRTSYESTTCLVRRNPGGGDHREPLLGLEDGSKGGSWGTGKGRRRTARENNEKQRSSNKWGHCKTHKEKRKKSKKADPASAIRVDVTMKKRQNAAGDTSLN